MDDADGLLAQLGVVIGPTRLKRERPKVEAPVRHTEWREGTTFVFDGYVARATETTCESCGASATVLDAVFLAERNPRTGAMRLQALGRGQQWPEGAERRLEVNHRFTLWCPGCLRGLGFRLVEEGEGEEG